MHRSPFTGANGEEGVLFRGKFGRVANQFSWTLLMLAAMEGDTPIGELLVSRGAALDLTNDFGETALALAAHGGHARFVQMLLAKGAWRDCRPHGQSLQDYVKYGSGLPQERIASILDLIAESD
jgi:ankyrin repeat protein